MRGLCRKDKGTPTGKGTLFSQLVTFNRFMSRTNQNPERSIAVILDIDFCTIFCGNTRSKDIHNPPPFTNPACER